VLERPRIPTPHLIGPPDPERRLRLLEIVRQRARERHYSDRTIATYVYWIRRYILHYDRRHPRELGPDEVREFIGRLSASSHRGVDVSLRARAPCTLRPHSRDRTRPSAAAVADRLVGSRGGTCR
jgi:hypothetical protein